MIKIYIYMKIYFEKIFPEIKDRVTITSSLLMLVPIILIYILGGGIEQKDYIIIAISFFFFTGSILNFLIDTLVRTIKRLIRKRKNKSV